MDVFEKQRENRSSSEKMKKRKIINSSMEVGVS